jgi:hypothetical protein
VGRPAAGVCKLASLTRKTAATDALGKTEFQALEFGDPLVDPRRPRARETRPMAAGRRALRRQLHLFILPAVYMLFAAIEPRKSSLRASASKLLAMDGNGP